MEQEIRSGWRRLRMSLALATRAMGRAVGISHGTFHHWDSGRSRPASDDAREALRVLMRKLAIEDREAVVRRTLDLVEDRTAELPWLTPPAWLEGQDPRRKAGRKVGFKPRRRPQDLGMRGMRDVPPPQIRGPFTLAAQPESRDPERPPAMGLEPALAPPPIVVSEKALERALEAYERGDAATAERIVRFAVKAIRGAREVLSEAKELGLATVVVLAGGAAVGTQPPLRDFDSKKISFTSGGRRRARVTGGRVVMFPAAHVPSGFHAASSRLMIAPRQPARSLVRAGT